MENGILKIKITPISKTNKIYKKDWRTICNNAYGYYTSFITFNNKEMTIYICSEERQKKVLQSLKNIVGLKGAYQISYEKEDISNVYYIGMPY